MIRLKIWQALIILSLMIAGIIGVIDWIYKQADNVATSRVNSEIMTGLKDGMPFYIKDSDIKLIPKGKKDAEITIVKREDETQSVIPAHAGIQTLSP